MSNGAITSVRSFGGSEKPVSALKKADASSPTRASDVSSPKSVYCRAVRSL
jgi:hypothetical protein